MMQKYTSSFRDKFPLLFFVIVLFFLSSCGKDSGDQCFDNRTNEPIELYIDGVYEFTLDENSEDCLFFGDGCYDWYVEGILTCTCISNAERIFPSIKVFPLPILGKSTSPSFSNLFSKFKKVRS